MSRAVAIVVASIKELWSLVVDDGFLAVAALGAVAVTFVLTREQVLGPVGLVGWLLLVLLVGALHLSVRRAISRHC